MKGAELFVKALENEGVTCMFGIPGEENLDFLEALRKSKITLVVTRHEQAAGFMAATYGRLTGKTGVCLSTLGPGATNFMTPASYALLGGMPVLFITGQKPIKKSKQGGFQKIDVVGLMEPVTKMTEQIVNAQNIPHLVREAFRTAESEKPGPVHLELPEDIAIETTDALPFEINNVLRPRSDLEAIKDAARMIEKAKSPLLLIAAGANRKFIREPLVNFVEKTGMYFMTTQMGKGVVNESHERFLGTAALSEHDYIHCAIKKSDLIINVGHDISEKPPFIMERDGVQVIHINFDPAQMDDVYFPQHELIGDIAHNIEHLTDEIKVSGSWEFDYFKRLKLEVEKHVYGELHEKSFPCTPQMVVSTVDSVMPDDGFVALDNGMYKIWFARNLKAHMPNTLILDNALASMGAGLPSAITAKLLFPDRKTIAVCGDGGFMMNSQEMETAIRLGLDLVVIVLRDDAYGMIKWKQQAMSFEDYGLDYGNPDFVKYAESYGAKGHRITESGQLGRVLSDCLNKKGIHLIEVPVDYSENEKVFIEELKKKTCIL